MSVRVSTIARGFEATVELGTRFHPRLLIKFDFRVNVFPPLQFNWRFAGFVKPKEFELFETCRIISYIISISGFPGKLIKENQDATLVSHGVLHLPQEVISKTNQSSGKIFIKFYLETRCYQKEGCGILNKKRHSRY